MQLVPASLDHVDSLKNWFMDDMAAASWGGPAMRFPFTSESFLEDIHWGKMPAWSVVGSNGVLQAFGQYYPRDQRCHLARLAVAPDVRGQGIGQAFIGLLMNRGMLELGVSACSLFVAMNNATALVCYQKLGFEYADWPDWTEPVDGIRFMVRVPSPTY